MPREIPEDKPQIPIVLIFEGNGLTFAFSLLSKIPLIQSSDILFLNLHAELNLLLAALTKLADPLIIRSHRLESSGKV